MIIVLQGRIRSTRLPAKGFLPFHGQTVWERMFDICKDVRGVDEVVFATSDSPENELARPLVEGKGLRFFSLDNENNVLRRFVKAIEDYDGEYMIRMTCDNYLVQPQLLEDLIELAVREKADYAYVAPLSHYAGEVVRCDTLRESFAGNYSDLSREHVTWDIREGKQSNIVSLPADHLGLDHSLSLTLDNIQDFIRMKNVEINYPETKNLRCVEEVIRLQGNVISEYT